MATSSFPAAVDWLVTNIRALPECASPVEVMDGWPSKRVDTGVVIGITPDDPETESEPVHAQLGAQMEREFYAIPCIVWAQRGGGEEAMKTARDAAYTIFDAISTLIRTPATGRILGGALHSGVAAVRAVRTMQTGTAAEAGEGRACEIRFDITCENRF